MDHGKILVEGKPADLIRSNAGDHVVEILNPGQGCKGVRKCSQIPARCPRPSDDYLRHGGR